MFSQVLPGGAAFVLCGVLLYAVVLPSMMVSQIDRLVQPRPSSMVLHNGITAAHMASRQLHQRRVVLHFAGVKSLQRLRSVLDAMRYQRIAKDIEDQATGGLDLAAADALASLGDTTSLQETQAWLRREVTGAVLQGLQDLQHPSDCTTARKLLCSLNKSCGFGCQIHHVVHCLAHAVALNRTMVMTDVYPSNYIQSPSGWEDVLQPVTSCSLPDTSSVPKLDAHDPNKHEDAEVVTLDVIDTGASRYDPPAMPWDVLEAVQLFNSRPQIWWVGVLTSYLLRPSGASILRHAAFRTAQGWGPPAVGVHIRRTDKLASSTEKRYSAGGFVGVYDDIMHLAACDVVVGTFSSQVSRMAYEVSMVNNTAGFRSTPFILPLALGGGLIAGAAISSLRNNPDAYCNGVSVQCYQAACEEALRNRCPDAAAESNNTLVLTACPDPRYSECYATPTFNDTALTSFECFGVRRPRFGREDLAAVCHQPGFENNAHAVIFSKVLSMLLPCALGVLLLLVV
ncbi:hypothetical protein COO60DRAFT_1627492 [Scenedesmus sp. NREL 46B-D3]|nr:hypothetical protein COO60DRAFT_1627492 [Scenedesmus sp. NREL 46B-D3]